MTLSTSSRPAYCAVALCATLLALGGCYKLMGEKGAASSDAPSGILENRSTYDYIELPEGYRIEKVAAGLTFPTGVTWDDEGTLYVSESGGGMAPNMLATPAIVRLGPDGRVRERHALARQGVHSPINDVTWHQDYLYLSHRMPDLTGAVSRMKPGGRVEQLITGLPSYFEHQTNEIVFANGKMYIAQGPPTNSGVPGPDIAPWVKARPDGYPVPAKDIVLTGENFESPNFLSDKPSDKVLTGAFVPFGTRTRKGQVVQGGGIHSGGTIIEANPDGTDAKVYAWGFRNIFGLKPGPDGTLFAMQNGMDMRGLRPAEHDKDALYRVPRNAWFGWPDFTATLDPITTMSPPDRFMPPNQKKLSFVIDHKASGLSSPDKKWLAASFHHHSSTNKFDFAPGSWAGCTGKVFAAQWGDLAPPTGPLHGGEAIGYKVVMADPKTGKVHDFARNKYKGPGSRFGMAGLGLERPIEVAFTPDGAMLVLDFGIVDIALDQSPPYAYRENTGMLWRITRTSGASTSCEGLPPREGEGEKKSGSGHGSGGGHSH